MVKDSGAVLDSNSSHPPMWPWKAPLVSLRPNMPGLVLNLSLEWANAPKLTWEGIFPLWNSDSTSLCHEVHVQLCDNLKNMFCNLSDFSFPSCYSGSAGVPLESTTSHWEVGLLPFLQSVLVNIFFKKFVQFTSVFKFTASDICAISFFLDHSFHRCVNFITLYQELLGFLDSVVTVSIL